MGYLWLDGCGERDRFESLSLSTQHGAHNQQDWNLRKILKGQSRGVLGPDFHYSSISPNYFVRQKHLNG
jgi:hypothetical protein